MHFTDSVFSFELMIARMETLGYATLLDKLAHGIVKFVAHYAPDKLRRPLY